MGGLLGDLIISLNLTRIHVSMHLSTGWATACITDAESNIANGFWHDLEVEFDPAAESAFIKLDSVHVPTTVALTPII